MNGKQAKRLRRAAMGLAVSLSESGKEIKAAGYKVITHKNSPLSASSLVGDINSPRTAEFPYPNDPFNPPSYQLVVREDSLKGIYKALKHSVA
jgi:hypothetical protein